MMRGSHATGTRLGEIARQILDGTPPEDIPIEQVPVVPTFDWRQLQRWGIDLSRLPAGADVRFRQPTAWESYRWYIIGTLLVVAAQLVLIAGLQTQITRRRRRRGDASNQLRTDSSPGRATDQRTGVCPRRHRAGFARRRVPAAGVRVDGRQRSQERLRRYSGHRDAAGLFRSRAGYEWPVRPHSAAVTRLASRHLARARPHAGIEGALCRGREAA